MGAKGTSQFGDDVVVGSPEYLRRWREKNKEKSKLAQAKYRAKQRERWLAVKVARADHIPIEQALAEVQGKVDTLKQVEAKLISEGRIPARASWDNGLVEVPEPEVEFIKEFAVKYNIDYAVAAEIMEREENPNKWEELMIQANRDKIAAIPSALDGNGE